MRFAYPGYGILFHGLASDALFAAAFAGWAVVLSRAILQPSVRMWLLAGLVMGLLVLVRPANQVLIVCTFLPLLMRVAWGRRLAWAASFFVASAVATQGWKALAAWRWDNAVVLRPSGVVLVTAFALLPLLFPAPWRRRLVLIAVPLVVAAIAVKGPSVENPVHYFAAVTRETFTRAPM